MRMDERTIKRKDNGLLLAYQDLALAKSDPLLSTSPKR